MISQPPPWDDVLPWVPFCRDVLLDMGYRDDPDGLVSDYGLETVHRCLKNFDPDRGEFSAYLRRALRSRFARAILFHREDGTGLVVVVDSSSDEMEQRDLLDCLLSRVSKYDQTLLRGFYLENLGFDGLAALTGLSESTMRRHTRRALRRCYDARTPEND